MKNFIQKCLSVWVLSMILSPISFAFTSQNQCTLNTSFTIGTGIYDITGPAAEEGMMGYGMLGQQTAGIAQRLWARAFVIESPCNGKRVAFVNVDLGQAFQGIKQQVVRKLKALNGERFTDENVLITANHTHSGPGGFSTYAFYNLSTLGFSRANFNTIVDGIVAAILRADANKVSAQIKFNQGELPGISYNRSPQAYLLNPKEERDRYPGDTDTTMSLVRFETQSAHPIGLINWFPLHGVSMNNKNYLINGDNKGYAEYLFEKDFNADYGPQSFVAAFAQANAGDVSPNPYGHEGGSGMDGISAVEKAGKPQYELAKHLFNNAQERVTGGIDYRHMYIAMNDVVIDPQFTNGQPQITCPAAIGVSMLAGTQDGEGIGKQGLTCATIQAYIPPFVCALLTTQCQGVKPIALQTGLMKPHPWTPSILPLQILKIGNLVIVAVPFELTTMSGRRLKETVAKEFPAAHHIVLATLANAYAGYVATNEEYQMQRYEGASTHFGPWTEAALRQEYSKLAKAMLAEKPVDHGPQPPDLSAHQLDFQPGVMFDSTPMNISFGNVYQNVKPTYQPGDTVQVVFWGAHPKNNFRTQDTFLAVQHLENGKWETIRRDRDWDTAYQWKRNSIAFSLITIVWRTSKDTPPGKYRIVHYGNAKSVLGGIKFYQGYSSIFTVK